MCQMMEHWVRDVGVDGFRCDVADKVPTAFWNEARARVEKIKPVFMLAEAEKPELTQRAFDSDYGYNYFWTYDKIAHNEATAEAIDKLRAQDVATYPRGAWRMMFTTNHDQNSWLDSDIHRLGGGGSRAFAVVAFTLPGKPLIYNGQEVGYAKKLAFFERDPIDWEEHDAETRAFYTRLCDLYRTHRALYEGSMEKVHTDRDDRVYSFWRKASGEPPLLVVANLSDRHAETLLDLKTRVYRLSDLLDAGSKKSYNAIGSELHLSLAPWEFHVFRAEQK
jgi:glycosidase